MFSSNHFDTLESFLDNKNSIKWNKVIRDKLKTIPLLTQIILIAARS